MFVKTDPTKEKSSTVIDEDLELSEDEVYGAKFFGGNTNKEEFYDPVAEAEADKLFSSQYVPTTQSKLTFSEDGLARDIVERLQNEVNTVLKKGGDITATSSSGIYSPNLRWETPLEKKTGTPLGELRSALEFYRDVQLSIISGQMLPSSNNQILIRWELSLIWPNFLDSRILLTGTSTLTVNDSTSNDLLITSQKDSLDVPLSTTFPSQLTPRFWDLYHIGMTPSAELVPLIPTSTQKGLFARYELHEIPPRLVYRPRIRDVGGRTAREAQALPNHSFTTVIKTMGPKKQKYVTTCPVEVAIEKNGEGENEIVWTVGVPPLVSSRDELPLPCLEEDEEEVEGATACYEYQPRRLVATLPFGGYPQDEGVAKVRKELYDAVVADGLKVKGKGKPQFFFWQHDAKACFVEDGLGMAVYEWRPKLSRSNNIGLELEL